MKEYILDWVQQITQTIYEKKGTDVIVIDVHNISSITYYVIIATGNVERHVISLEKEIEEIMHNLGQRVIQVEGLQHGDWVVLDYFHIVIHLFIPEMRQRYQLELLWSDGQILTLDLHT